MSTENKNVTNTYQENQQQGDKQLHMSELSHENSNTQEDDTTQDGDKPAAGGRRPRIKEGRSVASGQPLRIIHRHTKEYGSGEKSPFQPKSYGDNNNERYANRPFQGNNQRPFQPRSNERREYQPFQNRQEGFQKNPFQGRQEGYQKPYSPFQGRKDDERRPYQPFQNRQDNTDRRPYSPFHGRQDDERRPPYQGRQEGQPSHFSKFSRPERINDRFDNNNNNNNFRPRTPYSGGSEYNDNQGYKPQQRQQRPFSGRAPYGQNGRNGQQPYSPNAKYSHQKQLKYKEDLTDPNEPIRLNRFLANAGICSRREADDFIRGGLVKVNGEVITTLGTKITRQDEVIYKDKPVQIESKLYILLNKPRNCVTTSDDPNERLTVLDLVKNACKERIYPVGRLDRNSTGVMLLTNDGDLASKLTHPSYKKKKIYHVWLDKEVEVEDMAKLANGIELEDGEIHADAISYANEEDRKQVGIEIHSGRNRVVRRMFEHLGYHVNKLDRVYFAGLTKKNLPRGKWKYLNEKDVNALRMGHFG